MESLVWFKFVQVRPPLKVDLPICKILCGNILNCLMTIIQNKNRLFLNNIIKQLNFFIGKR